MDYLMGRVSSVPRTVAVKSGKKMSVVDVATSDRGNFTIWRDAGDSEVMGRQNGEKVKLLVDSSGRASILEHAGNSSVAPADSSGRQMGFATEQPEPETKRSAEIADYIHRLGKLYGHCLKTASTLPTDVELDAPQIKDVATTLFIQTIRHFNL